MFVAKILKPMKDQIDIEKVLRQQLEIDEFFTGDFALKGQQSDESAPSHDTAEAAEGLKIIADLVNRCSKCGLSVTRTNAVPGEGSPKARIVFVGEAPGADEDARGKPFIGRAGKLLGDIIKAMGLQRSDVFICNILKCRPPDNRDPRPDEVIKCEPYLKKQLELIRPEVIIALGAHAARTLLETNKPIGQLRGRFHDYYFSEDAEPIKLMPTYHPAYLLRNYSPDNRKRVWEDMKKVLADLGMKVPASQKTSK